MGGGLLVVAHAPDALAQESGRAAQGRAGAGDSRVVDFMSNERGT
jgi:hypothetical protein